jgi:hypothetical protein
VLPRIIHKRPTAKPCLAFHRVIDRCQLFA